jgi:outer membrane protein assembly factor BamB
VRVRGRSHDVFVVTTTYGRTLAVDASRARVLWEFTPPGIGGWEGSAQITQATPIADTSRRFVFAASPDGRVHRLSLDSGRETAEGDWPVSLTRDASHEKLPAALNLSRGRVIVTTGGYKGDAPPYQGKVVTIDRRSGRIVRVFNALCSDRKRIIEPSSCPESGSAIWARQGAVVDPASGNLLAVTGNGNFNERTDWGDSVIELTPDGGRLVGSFTPPNQAELEASDTDFGSTAPAILPGRLVSQSGKDGLVRLLDLRRLPRRGNAAQIQSLPAPEGQGVFSAPAVLRASGRRAVVYYANDSATAAYELRGRRLRVLWQNGTPGTSPVIAGRLVWIYDHVNGGLNVYRPSSPEPLHTLPSGPGHWNSPIVVDGRVALPEGDGNAHETSGVLNIYSLRR